jgi:ABC-type polysaccharide/polyol phosphate transport system ATPase subunit
MSESAITVEGVSKAYRIWETPAARLISPLLAGTAARLPAGFPGSRWLRRRAESRYRDFWALRDISFEVRRGEAIGIVGRNGSGKSTLLQIIAGTLQPTSGRVAVAGRVAALLELGAGFNPEFTGRENVFLNGAVLGLSRADVAARLEAIAAFAEIGEFLDQPVRTYSSGMVVRLAFAVAVHVEPEILIVDEALAVGDARFQLKCARAIDRFLARGVTLLFVSHDASMVKRLCRRAVLLELGQALYTGHPNDVINLYSRLTADGDAAALGPDIAEVRRRAESAPPPDLGSVAAPPVTRDEALLTDERSHIPLSGAEFSYGGELGRIAEITVLDASGRPRLEFTSGEKILVRLKAEAREACPEPIFALTLKNTAGVEIYGTNTLFSGQPAGPMGAGEVHLVEFAFPLDLMPGHYFLSLGFTRFAGENLLVLHRRYDAVKLEVTGTDRTFGIANLRAVIASRPFPTGRSTPAETREEHP